MGFLSMFGGEKKGIDPVYLDQFCKVAGNGNVGWEAAVEVPDRIRFACNVCQSRNTVTFDLDNPASIPHEVQEFVKFHAHRGNWHTLVNEEAKGGDKIDSKAQAEQKIKDAITKYKVDADAKIGKLEQKIKNLQASQPQAPQKANPGQLIDTVFSPKNPFPLMEYVDYLGMSDLAKMKASDTAAQIAVKAAAHQVIMQQMYNKGLDAAKELKELKTVHEPIKRAAAPKVREGRRFR